MYARGIIIGITRGTNKGHIVRATLEAIAYQVRDVVDVMSKEADIAVPHLRVDGGGTGNSLLMQFQADILGIPIELTSIPDTTALGAGFLAGLAVGVWQNTGEIARTALYFPDIRTENAGGATGKTISRLEKSGRTLPELDNKLGRQENK